jgi:hypothetical protein
MRKVIFIAVGVIAVALVAFMGGAVSAAGGDSERIVALKVTVSAILEAQRVFVCSMGVEEICPGNWEVYQVSE